MQQEVEEGAIEVKGVKRVQRMRRTSSRSTWMNRGLLGVLGFYFKRGRASVAPKLEANVEGLANDGLILARVLLAGCVGPVELTELVTLESLSAAELRMAATEVVNMNTVIVKMIVTIVFISGVA